MWPSHMCWIGKPVTCCYTTYMYVDGMGLYTNVDSPLFWVHYSRQKISENKTALNCGFGFAIAYTIKVANLKFY